MTNNTWTNILTAVPILPPYCQYSQIAMPVSGNYDFAWPSDFASAPDDNVLTNWLDLEPSVTGAVLVMPSVTQQGVGAGVLIRNIGSQSVNVNLNNNTFYLTIPTGKAFILLLQDNTTSQGTWTNLQFGTGTSAADAATLAGYGLIADGVKLDVNTPITSFASSFSVTASMRGSLINYTGGEGDAYLPLGTVTGIGNGFKVSLRNSSTIGGTLTVSSPGGTVDGRSFIILTPDASASFVSDGANNYLSESLVLPYIFTFADLKFVLNQQSALAPDAQSLGDIETGLLKNTKVTTLPHPTGTLSKAVAGVDYYSPNNPTILYDDSIKSNLSVGKSIVFQDSAESSTVVGANTQSVENTTNVTSFGASPILGGANGVNNFGRNIYFDGEAVSINTIGSNNHFDDAVHSIVLLGDENYIGGGSQNSNIIGGGNTLGASSNNITIIGNGFETPGSATNYISIGNGAVVTTDNYARIGNDKTSIVTGNTTNPFGTYSISTFETATVGSGIYLGRNTSMVQPTTEGGVLITDSNDDLYFMNKSDRFKIAPIEILTFLSQYAYTALVTIAAGNTNYIGMTPSSNFVNLLQASVTDPGDMLMEVTFGYTYQDSGSPPGTTVNIIIDVFFAFNNGSYNAVPNIIPCSVSRAIDISSGVLMYDCEATVTIPFRLRDAQNAGATSWAIGYRSVSSGGNLIAVTGGSSVIATTYYSEGIF